MNINNNFTPLSWHQGTEELQSHRATYAFGHVVPLMAHNRTLIPFQIITEAGAVNIQDYTVSLCNLDGSVKVSDIGMTLTKAESGAVDVLIYNGGILPNLLPIGQYYLVLTSTTDNDTATWYSDVLTIVDNVSKMTSVEWWDDFDLKFRAGVIVYKFVSGGQSVQYRNKMYFLEEIGMPEYTVEEDGETRDGLFYSSRVLSGKKYKMRIEQLTEAMCDALRFVHLSDHVVVRDGYGRVYQCDSVLVTPEWQNGGAVASATVEMTTDTFVKQLGGGYEGDSPEIDGGTGVVGSGVIGETFVIGM